MTASSFDLIKRAAGGRREMVEKVRRLAGILGGYARAGALDARLEVLHRRGLIDTIPTRFRRAMLDKHITRLVKSDNGGPTFEQIHNPGDVIKLAARGGASGLFDIAVCDRHPE